MLSGYYINKIIQNVKSAYFNFKLRNRGNTIGRNCTISNDVVIKGIITFKDNVVIRSNVTLCNNVIVGKNASIENVKVEENSHIESGVIITGCGKGKIIIGKESYIGVNNVLDWSDDITIGNFVHIAGPSTGLWTHSSAKQCTNGLNLNDKNPKFRPTLPIVIEDNVYVGGNCTIYPGVTIGHHSIVAPNSAVNINVEPYSLVGGVPAKFIEKIVL